MAQPTNTQRITVDNIVSLIGYIVFSICLAIIFLSLFC